jgi:hypothetical protein
MNVEDNISGLMTDATRAISPPVDEILTQARRRGRRLRAQRRAAVLGGTAAVGLAALAGTVVAAGSAPGGTDRQGHIAAAAGASSVPATKSATDPALPPSPPPGLSEQIVTVMKQLLPRGYTFSNALIDNYGPTSFYVDIDDGHGTSMVFVGVSPAAHSGSDPLNCAGESVFLLNHGPRAAGAVPVSCTVKTFPNGDKAMELVQGTMNSSGVFDERVIATDTDGLSIEIWAANAGADDQSSVPTRTNPPLDIAAWTNIALSTKWLSIPTGE